MNSPSGRKQIIIIAIEAFAAKWKYPKAESMTRKASGTYSVSNSPFKCIIPERKYLLNIISLGRTRKIS